MIKDFVIINQVPILRGLQAEKAKDLFYDNTKSQLQATNSQDAIDEINGKMLKYPHFSNQIYTHTGSVFYVCEQDCYVSCITTSANAYDWKVNGSICSVVDSHSGYYVSHATFYAQKGDQIQGTGVIKVWGLR